MFQVSIAVRLLITIGRRTRWRIIPTVRRRWCAAVVRPPVLLVLVLVVHMHLKRSPAIKDQTALAAGKTARLDRRDTMQCTPVAACHYTSQDDTKIVVAGCRIRGRPLISMPLQ